MVLLYEKNIAPLLSKILMQYPLPATAILSTAYLPPIQYLSKFLLHKTLHIDQYEHYLKQSYRNRCRIYAANSTQTLSIPIVKTRRPKVALKDIRISYDNNWQDKHWRAIISAYNSSPFFEYYRDSIEPFFSKMFKFLIDFNHQLLMLLLQEFEIDTQPKYTEQYYQADSNNMIDYRQAIHPKHPLPDIAFDPHSYYQVFADRRGFQPNLSCIDLLFNEGPGALDILQQSINQTTKNDS